MNKKISLGAAISFMAIVAAVTVVITMSFSLSIFNQKVSNVMDREEQYKKLSEIDTLVRQKYYGDIDEETLNDWLARGYMSGLGDPYSFYLSKDEYAKKISSNDGELVGVGMTAKKDASGYIQIVTVYENSPAQQAGLQEGDIIVAVDGNDVLEIGYDTAVDMISGEEGTTVSLTVRRDGVDTSQTLTRRKMEVLSVEMRMIGSNAVIRITDFNRATVEQFQSAIASAQEQGATGIIFDVRGNPGGLLESVLDVLDVLLPECDIMTVTYHDGSTETFRTSDADEIDLPMVVLTNGDTASAAELFSAVLRDYGKAKLVGTTTYGKGVMQDTFKLRDGSAVQVTVASFAPPKTANFNGVGLKPDFEQALPAELEQRLDSLTDEEDTQLKKAVEVVDTAKAVQDQPQDQTEEASEESSQE